MAKTAVELLLKVQMVEGCDEVVPVEMSIDTEDLAKDELGRGSELAREAAAAAKPLFVGLLVVLMRVAGGERIGTWGRLSSGGGRGRAGEGHSGNVGGEHGGVVNLAGYPALHERHVFVRGEIDGLVVRVEPCVRAVPGRGQRGHLLGDRTRCIKGMICEGGLYMHEPNGSASDIPKIAPSCEVFE